MIREKLTFLFVHLPRHLTHIYITHIRKNTWKLRFNRFGALPTPHKANRVSRRLRRLFEAKRIQQIFGANLGAALMLAPLLNLNQPGVMYEPKVEIPSTVVTSPSLYDTPVTTEERKFVVPVDNLKYMAQGFHTGHPGYDLNAHIGSPVRAFTSGQVYKIEDGQFGLGRYIVLDHGDQLFSVYAHLQRFNVTLGQVVNTGDIIGFVGMTGMTTGPHVHFEIHDNGVAINPKTYLGF